MKALHALGKKFPTRTNFNKGQKTSLICEDPVVCCMYFKRLIYHIMTLLSTNSPKNPFGQYCVKDHFIRIEFQNRGNPHAHIMLWINIDPKEMVSENMPKTIELIESLLSFFFSSLQCLPYLKTPSSRIRLSRP